MSSEAVNKAAISDNQTKMSEKATPGEKSPVERCPAVEEEKPYIYKVEEAVPYTVDTIDRSPGDLKEKVERRKTRERERGTREPTVITKLFRDVQEYQQHDGKGRIKKKPPSTVAEGRIKKKPPKPREEGRIKKNPPNLCEERQKVELYNKFKMLEGNEDDRRTRFAALDQVMKYYRGRAARRQSEFYWRPSSSSRMELEEMTQQLQR